MAILDILTYPDEFLRQTAKPVENINGETQHLIDDMAETMYHAPGVGLAALQVGIDRSIIVYDISTKEEAPDLQVLINPRIIQMEGSTISKDEGCLSVPDYKSDVKRAACVLVEGVDRDGNPLRIDAEDFLAIVLQHEIDHLTGVLFIDHISSLKRQMYKRRVMKQLKQSETHV